MATKKVTELVAATDPADGDQILMIDVSEALDVDKTKKVARSVLAPPRIRARAGSALTIASGVITLSGDDCLFEINGQGAAADDLDTINGGADGDVVLLLHSGETITLTDADNIDTGDYGEIQLLAAGDIIALRYDGSNWYLLYSNTAAFRLVGFGASYDNGAGGASITIDWNEGNQQLLQIDTNACDLTYTDPPRACALRLILIGDGTLRTNVDADHDADAEWLYNGEPYAYGDTDDEVIGILNIIFDPDITPKYLVSGMAMDP